MIRFDMLLVLILSILIALDENRGAKGHDSVSKSLYVLIGYIFVSLPFVEWPGSVIKENFFTLLKSIVFFFFSVNIIKTEKELKIFMAAYLSCQTFRVFEPTWLHITEGYWGSSTHMGHNEFLDRLSGGPFDVVNPNGLASIIVFSVPFLYYLTKHASMKFKLLFYFTVPIFTYALLLTQSRSGMIGIVVVIGCIIRKSKHKIIWIALVLLSAIIIFSTLDPISQERYQSIYRKDVRGAETASGRTEGWRIGFMVFLNRPLFGHGLGTSVEANANYAGYGQRCHNLYLEVLQELGIIGFIIFMMYLKNIFKSFLKVKNLLKAKGFGLEKTNNTTYLFQMVNAMEIWMITSIVFSMASYGLNIPTWYFFGGLSAVIFRLAENNA